MRPASSRGVVVLAVVAVVALLGVFALGVGLGPRVLGTSTPSVTSAEAGFARDMQAHHQQAVEMALVVREKSTDPVLRSVAYDIATSQSQQSGQMYAWLTEWGLPQTGSGPRMAWMSPLHDGSMLQSDGRMPGMASTADLARLRAATGRTAEVLFLQLMVVHHRAGVQMAQAVLDRTDRSDVRTLARSIVSAQTAEIGQMDELLAARGAAAA